MRPTGILQKIKRCFSFYAPQKARIRDGYVTLHFENAAEAEAGDEIARAFVNFTQEEINGIKSDVGSHIDHEKHIVQVELPYDLPRDKVAQAIEIIQKQFAEHCQQNLYNSDPVAPYGVLVIDEEIFDLMAKVMGVLAPYYDHVHPTIEIYREGANTKLLRTSGPTIVLSGPVYNYILATEKMVSVGTYNQPGM